MDTRLFDFGSLSQARANLADELEAIGPHGDLTAATLVPVNLTNAL
jgi:hypothetical protein